jgi:hypothetical protein
VGNKRKRLAGRLLITDSKKAYCKSTGIKHLQRTVLACLQCLYKEPANLVELLTMLCPDFLDRLEGYPWYKDAESYRIQGNQADTTITSRVFKDDLATAGIELLTVRSCCLDVEYYNRMMESVKNKASVLFTATSQLIKSAFDNFAGRELQIIVDRQGGRIHYRKSLQRMFPHTRLQVLRESTASSSYELQTNNKRMRVHFVVGADERFLPVCLASMVSKYLREVLIDSINRYFGGFGADLRPTAGYWKDGLRFIQDLKTKLPEIQYDSNQLIRCR